MKIQTLILFKFIDTPRYYGEFNINARTEEEARGKLYEFLKETGYINEHPSMLDTMFDNFKLDSVNVINAVIV